MAMSRILFMLFVVSFSSFLPCHNFVTSLLLNNSHFHFSLLSVEIMLLARVRNDKLLLLAESY